MATSSTDALVGGIGTSGVSIGAGVAGSSFEDIIMVGEADQSDLAGSDLHIGMLEDDSEDESGSDISDSEIASSGVGTSAGATASSSATISGAIK